MSNSGWLLAKFAISRNQGQGTITLAEVTSPCFSASMLATFTVCDMPRSSACTISTRSFGPYPIRSAVDWASSNVATRANKRKVRITVEDSENPSAQSLNMPSNSALVR